MDYQREKESSFVVGVFFVCLFVGLLLTIVQLLVPPQPCGVAPRVFYQGGNWEVK